MKCRRWPLLIGPHREGEGGQQTGHMEQRDGQIGPRARPTRIAQEQWHIAQHAVDTCSVAEVGQGHQAYVPQLGDVLQPRREVVAGGMLRHPVHTGTLGNEEPYTPEENAQTAKQGQNHVPAAQPRGEVGCSRDGTQHEPGRHADGHAGVGDAQLPPGEDLGSGLVQVQGNQVDERPRQQRTGQQPAELRDQAARHAEQPGAHAGHHQRGARAVAIAQGAAQNRGHNTGQDIGTPDQAGLEETEPQLFPDLRQHDRKGHARGRRRQTGGANHQPPKGPLAGVGYPGSIVQSGNVSQPEGSDPAARHPRAHRRPQTRGWSRCPLNRAEDPDGWCRAPG